jgi:hypothetical protein
MKARPFIAAGLLLVAAWPAWAQNAQKVTGQVVDSAGKPVAGAEVARFWSIQDGKLGAYQSAKTNADGKYALEVQFYGQPEALLAYDKDRKTGGLVVIGPKNADKQATIKLGPLVRLHGDFFCKDINKKPTWTNVMLMPVPGNGRCLQCMSTNADFSVQLPPGKYHFQAYGTDIARLEKDFDLAVDKPDVALGTIDTPATVIAKHVGKAPPDWNVTDARGVAKTVKLSDFKGKWVMIEFWDFW